MEKPPISIKQKHKETRNKRENREQMNALVIGVLKLLDEGIRPLLNVRGHGARQRLLLHLLHRRL
jgi:hypothetical protein